MDEKMQMIAAALERECVALRDINDAMVRGEGGEHPLAQEIAHQAIGDLWAVIDALRHAALVYRRESSPGEGKHLEEYVMGG